MVIIKKMDKSALERKINHQIDINNDLYNISNPNNE